MANPKIVLKFVSALKGDSVSFKIDGVLSEFVFVAAGEILDPLEVHAGVGEALATEFAGSFNLADSGDLYTTTVDGNELTIEADTDSPSYNFGTVVIDDAKGSDITLLEQVVTGISLGAVVTDATGYGVADGEIDLTVTGGTGPFDYLWSDGSISEDRTGLPAGTYSVVVTDSLTNQVTLEAVVDEPDALSLEALVDEDDITVTVSGGVDPYSYLWSTGAETKDLADQEPGTYTLTVTDDNGNVAELIVTISAFRFYFSQNPVPLELVAADPETKPNLSFVNETLVQKAYPGAYELVSTEEHLPDDAGSTVFQIEAYLDAFLKSYVPDPGLNEIVRADGMFTFFYARHYEKYGTPAEPGSSTVVSNNAVILGGLSDVEQAAGTFFDTYFAAQKPFLNWEYPLKIVLPAQPDYLYFIVNSFDQTGMRVRVKVYFSDETDVTVTKYTMDTIVKRYEVYCFPVGYTQMNLEAVNVDKTVIAYDVWVEDQDDLVVSEVRAYELDLDYYPYERYLLYLSSLGGMSVVALTGKAEKSVKMDQEYLEKYLGHSFEILDLGQQVTYSRGKPSIRFSSGYIVNQTAFERLEDFISSEEFYLLDADRWIPVRVDADRTPIYDETRQDALNVLSGTLYLPEQRRFTPRL